MYSPHVSAPIFCKQFPFLRVSACLTRPIFLDLIAEMVPGEECTPRRSAPSTWSPTSCIVRIAAQTLYNIRHVQFWRFLLLITLSFFHSLTLVTKHNLQGISGPNQFYQHLHCESSTSAWGDRWWMSPKTFLASDYNRLRALRGLYSIAGAVAGTQFARFGESRAQYMLIPPKWWKEFSGETLPLCSIINTVCIYKIWQHNTTFYFYILYLIHNIH